MGQLRGWDMGLSMRANRGMLGGLTKSADHPSGVGRVSQRSKLRSCLQAHGTYHLLTAGLVTLLIPGYSTYASQGAYQYSSKHR